MSASLVRLSVEQAEEQRAKPLSDLGVTEDELRARARQFTLNERELAVLDDIDGLDFLLGHSRSE